MTLQSYSGVYIQRKLYLKRYMNSSVPSSTVYNSQDMQATKRSLTDECIKKICYTYTMENNTAIRRKLNKAICSNMDGLEDYHTKWSKSQRERQIP